MAEQKTKPASPAKKQETTQKDAKDLKNEELDESVDDLMAEIDEVLEENCEQFVKDYVQRGGE